MAEIVRSGIMAVDIGQFEAGRSLGLNYKQTMLSIILPQAVKNILPALCNEFISLLKETSISGYIGLMDLTKGGDIIRSVTYEAFMPLIAVAAIYFLIVMGLSKAVGLLAVSYTHLILPTMICVMVILLSCKKIFDKMIPEDGKEGGEPECQ